MGNRRSASKHPQAWVLYDPGGCHECEELKTPAQADAGTDAEIPDRRRPPKMCPQVRHADPVQCSVLHGEYDDNEMMAFLQAKALENRGNGFDAYGNGRMTEVLNALTGK